MSDIHVFIVADPWTRTHKNSCANAVKTDDINLRRANRSHLFDVYQFLLSYYDSKDYYCRICMCRDLQDVSGYVMLIEMY